MGTRGLELGVARVEEEARAKEEDESETLFKDPKHCIHLGLETYQSLESCTQGTVGLPMPALKKIP